MSQRKKVCIIGSGNWGTAISLIVSRNVSRYSNHFDSCVRMYVFEEIVNGRKLTEIINEEHENVKYLRGYRIPENVVACSNIVESAQDADIVIFVVPHQFVEKVCEQLKGKIKNTAIGISLIKGFVMSEGGDIDLITQLIERNLSIKCSVLMGANIAIEVAAGNYAETTIGCRNKKSAELFKILLESKYFRVTIIDDVEAVELCGSLKNIVACAAGFSDGFDYGNNTKAAIIRLGLIEMIRFARTFHKSTKPETFFESCGVADLIATCYGGRNRMIAEAFIKSGKSMEKLEQEMLEGQKLQGPMTAADVNQMLKKHQMEDEFPLFTAVHRVCIKELEAVQFFDQFKHHSEYSIKL